MYNLMKQNKISLTLFLLLTRVCSIFRSAGKFCLAHGLSQLTQDTKSDVSCLQTLNEVQIKKIKEIIEILL